jgi:hypothetical protein
MDVRMTHQDLRLMGCVGTVANLKIALGYAAAPHSTTAAFLEIGAIRLSLRRRLCNSYRIQSVPEMFNSAMLWLCFYLCYHAMQPLRHRAATLIGHITTCKSGVSAISPLCFLLLQFCRLCRAPKSFPDITETHIPSCGKSKHINKEEPIRGQLW